MSPQPSLYIPLADYLEANLGRPGTWMPEELDIADTHDVSTSTVRRALRHLAAKGVIVHVTARGYYVAGADPVPSAAYEFVARALREHCKGLPPHTKISSEHELVEKHSASRGVVRAAIDILKREGLLYSIHGRGVYTTEPSTEDTPTGEEAER